MLFYFKVDFTPLFILLFNEWCTLIVVHLLHERQTDRQTDGQADRQTDRQTEGTSSKPQLLKLKESRSGIKPRSFCLPAYHVLPLGQTCSTAIESVEDSGLYVRLHV